ncbi:MAG: glycoside hydrolase [Dactylosporangium sp.]|nr:glycoside hydrolase [Dactylosporangium sp.]
MREPTPYLVAVPCLLAAVALAVPALAEFRATASAPRTAGPDLAASWAGPLSTQGRYVVDARRNRFKLKSGNWHGGSGTWNGSGDPGDPTNNHAGEKSDQMPLGLDRVPMAEIVASFHELGLNSIRLQFSNEMIHDTRPVPDASVKANPNLLIIVEGINWTGLPVDGLPHGRPTLEPVGQLSHTLVTSHKLVYAAHFYGYTGPNHSGATGIGETHDPRYQDLTRDQLFDTVRRQALYVALDGDRHYTAPVWISEFGVGGRDNTDQKSRDWFHNFVDYLVAIDADFAYWPLVGWHENRHGNGWALMHWDAAGSRMGLYDGDDWRRLVNSVGVTGPVAPVTTWSMLTLDHGDFNQSLRMRGFRTGILVPVRRPAPTASGSPA